MHEYLVTYEYTPDQRLTGTESGALRPLNSRARLTARLVIHADSIREALAAAGQVLTGQRDDFEILAIARQDGKVSRDTFGKEHE